MFAANKAEACYTYAYTSQQYTWHQFFSRADAYHFGDAKIFYYKNRLQYGNRILDGVEKNAQCINHPTDF